MGSSYAVPMCISKWYLDLCSKNRSPVKLKKYGTLVYVQIVGPSVKLKNKKVSVCNGSFLNKWYRVSRLFTCLKITLCAHVSARDSIGGSKGGYTV